MFISDRLVEMIERSADELARKWLEDVRKRPETPTYHTFDPDVLFQRVKLVYSKLGQWISRETTEEEIAAYYVALGDRRRKEGFALSEVVWALVTTRRRIWLKVLSEGFLDTSLELNQALELNNRVVQYFDKAGYYLCVGYERGEQQVGI
jgi:hypothetical protein